MKRREPWYQRATRREDCIRRGRACPLCYAARETVEFTALYPAPASTPDRCPECITGFGRVKATRYADDMKLGPARYRPHRMIAVGAGPVVRIRKCQDCQHKWTTLETLPGAAPCWDVSRCECGKRMTICNPSRGVE